MRPVAVFDTNVLYSWVGWQGKPNQCVELARTGVVEGVTCRELLDELAEKLQSKLSFSAAQALASDRGRSVDLAGESIRKQNTLPA